MITQLWMRDVGTSSRARAARLACLAMLSCTNDIRFTPQAEPLGAAGAGTQGPEGPAGRWEPSFAEECDGPLDANRINTFMPNAAGQPIHLWTPRGEYIDERNVSVAAGDCVISVRHEAVGDREYSSGTLNTAGHFEQHGGYFEARFWPPAGAGFWTFWWLRAADAEWPPGIEFFNFSTTMPVYTAQFYDPSGNQHSGGVDTGDDVTKGYHTAGVEWTDTELLFYFDGAVRFRTSDDVPNLVEPMYPIVNLSVNTGAFGAPVPDETTPEQAELRIDWLRVWRRPP